MEDTLTIKLKRAIEVTDIRVDEITLVEPTIGMVRDAFDGRGSETDKTIKLIALASGQPVAVIEKLPISASKKAEAFLAGFIADAGE